MEPILVVLVLMSEQANSSSILNSRLHLLQQRGGHIDASSSCQTRQSVSINGVHHIEPLPLLLVYTFRFVVFHLLVVALQPLAFNSAMLRCPLEPICSHPLRNILENLLVSHHAIEFSSQTFFTDDTQEGLHLLGRPWFTAAC